MDVNAESNNFGQGPHDGAEGVLRDPLLIEFFVVGHVVDWISHSDEVVDDKFLLVLDEGQDIDHGGSRGEDGGKGVQQGGFEGVPVVNVDIRCKVDAAGVGKGGTSQSVDDLGHSAGVGPSWRIFSMLDPGNPLFASENVGFVSTEERELGEVGLPEVFSEIGHFKF